MATRPFHSQLRPDPSSGRVSGARASRYALVRQCMARYISPIMVDSVLARAMDSNDATSQGVSQGTMEEIVEGSMIGLRLFVEPHRLPDLMVELAEILAREDI